MPEDPYACPVTGVLRDKLGLSTTGELETAEREVTHAAEGQFAGSVAYNVTVTRLLVHSVVRWGLSRRVFDS